MMEGAQGGMQQMNGGQGGYINDDDSPWYTGGANAHSDSPETSPMAAHQQFGGQMINQFSSFLPQDQPQFAVGTPDMDNYDNEPPILEELGIRFDHILSKTQAVLYPKKELSEHILDDADLAGPLCFCMLLGACLLLSGKIHFGYIYGFSVFGCTAMYILINLLHSTGLDVWRVCSVLGYCLIPVILLATLHILLSLKSMLGVVLSVVSIGWSTLAATRIFDAKLHLAGQYWLVAYPTMLLYSCFVIITIF